MAIKQGAFGMGNYEMPHDSETDASLGDLTQPDQPSVTAGYNFAYGETPGENIGRWTAQNDTRDPDEIL